MQTPITNPQVPTIYTVFGTSFASEPPTVINEYAALTIPAFWSAVRVVSETIAGLPRAVYRKQGGTRSEVDGHPLTRLMRVKPNAYNIPFTLWETWVSHAVVWGNGYLAIGRDPMGRAASLVNLPPEGVTPFRILPGEEKTAQAVGQWYHVRPATGGGKPYVLPAADVLHLPGLGYDGMAGYPVVPLMAEALELSRNALRFSGRYFKRGTQVQGSIEIPAGVTDDQIKLIKLQVQQHSGMDSPYTHIVLSGGATLKNTTLPPQHSQLVETMGFTIGDVCRILRVPPHMVYELGRATWANIEQMSLDFVKFSLRSWIEKGEEELAAKLLSESEIASGHYIHHNLDALLRGDSTAVTTNVLAQVNGGLRTPNEGRALLDLPPMPGPGADELRTPVGGNPGDKGTGGQGDKENKAPVPPAKNARAAIEPVLQAAVARVQTKTDKAFEQHAKDQDRTIWGNVFAEQQKAFVIECLEPVNRMLAALGIAPVDAAKLAERYAGQIRLRASRAHSNTEAKSLATLLNELANEESHGPEES